MPADEFVPLTDVKYDAANAQNDSSTDEFVSSRGGEGPLPHEWARRVSLFEAQDDLSAEGCIAIKSMTGYRKVLWSEFLHVLLSLCTGFLWLLSAHWFPKFHYRFRFRRVENLEDAEYVFVEAQQGAPELCRVQPLREQCVRCYIMLRLSRVVFFSALCTRAVSSPTRFQCASSRLTDFIRNRRTRLRSHGGRSWCRAATMATFLHLRASTRRTA